MSFARKTENGATMVEAAIILPLLIVLLASLIDLSCLLIARHQLGRIALDAAQQGAATVDFGPAKYGKVMFLINKELARTWVGLTNTQKTISGPADLNGNQNPVVRVELSGVYRYFFLFLLGLSESEVEARGEALYEFRPILIFNPPPP